MVFDPENKCYFSQKFKTVVLSPIVRQSSKIMNLRRKNDKTNAFSIQEAERLEKSIWSWTTASRHFNNIKKKYKGCDLIVPIFSDEHAMAFMEKADGQMLVFNPTAE